jgi:hypothetical protein
MLSTVDLLVLTSLDQVHFILPTLCPFYKTSYLNEEVNCTEHSPSVRVPWLMLSSNHPPETNKEWNSAFLKF